MAGNKPIAFVFEWRSAAPAEAWRLAGENEFPLSVRRRREQGLGPRAQFSVQTQVHNHQPIVSALPEISQGKGLGAQHRAIQPTFPWLTEDEVLTAQFQKFFV